MEVWYKELIFALVNGMKSKQAEGWGVDSKAAEEGSPGICLLENTTWITLLRAPLHTLRRDEVRGPAWNTDTRETTFKGRTDSFIYPPLPQCEGGRGG